MNPQKLVHITTRWALGLLCLLTIAALAPTLAAQEASKLSVAGGGIATPSQTTCPATVLAGGTGNSGNERAPNTNFRWGRSVYLITAAELAANGYATGNSPTTIGWVYNVGNTAGASAPLIIYMENTADTTNLKSTTWATAITGMTTVHNAVTAVPSAAGPFDVTFTGGSPFTYTGGGLYIAFDWGQYTGTLSTTANIDCNIALVNGLKGAQSSTAAPTTLANSNFRPATRLGSSTQNDKSVDDIRSFGELPLGLVPPQVTRAKIANKGAAAATDVMTTLNITGADTFTDMQTIASLASCSGQAVAAFMGFTPGALGTDTVTVSVPADDFPGNNSLSKLVSITPRDYSYKHPGSTAGGGVGFTGATGAIVCKFPITAANAVTAVKLEFNAVTTVTYRVAIYGDSGTGTPSTTPLYVDAADRTVTAAGPITITLPSPVAVPAGNFFAGVHQTNTINGSLSFDVESPLRTGAFYEDSPLPVASWADLGPGATFKINVGVVLQNGVPAPTTAVSRKLHAGVPFDIDLLAANPIECRSGGANNDYQIVYTFPSAVTFTSATVSSGTGTVQSSSGSGTTTVTVDLTGVTNIQRITVKLLALTEAGNPANTGDLGLTMGVLVGDTNGNGAVNSGDTIQTRGRSGQSTDATNFRSDVNTDGNINAGDALAVRSRSGTALP